MSAYKDEGKDALRAWHLERVTRRFTVVISADNAALLAGLLGSDGKEPGSAA